MKVVLCANTSWYIYNYRKNLVAEIQRNGHEVFVIAPYDKYTQKLFPLGVRWFHLHLHQTSKYPHTEILSFVHIFWLLKKIRPDVVLSFTIKCNLYVGLLHRICRYRQIANISGLGEIFDNYSFFTKFVCVLYKTALKYCQKVFFQNSEDLHTFVQQGILPEYMCERIPGSGVDLSTFTPSLANYPGKPRIFLMFGRLVPRKGYELFLQAAQECRKECNNTAKFWILGMQDKARKESRALHQKIREYHNIGIVTYFPATENVIPTIRQADVVVLPSHYNEGVPRSLLEAMACGKPIITTAWKGCRDTVDEGINGYLIQKGSLYSLKRAIDFFIQADEYILCQMGEASRKKAEKEFDENAVIAKYLSEIHVAAVQKRDDEEKSRVSL